MTTSFSDLLTADARERIRPGAWRAAPPVQQREQWAGLDPREAERVLEDARSRREDSALNPPTLSLWNHYHLTGERVPYETAQRALLGRTGGAALALAITDDEEELDALGDAVWQLCEQSAWCLPSHYALPEDGSRPRLPQPGRDILDLSDGYVGGMLAAIDSFAGDRLEERFPGLRARVHHELRRRVLGPWREELYFWDGRESTPNNWAPWIVSNVLVCAAVVEQDREVLVEDVRRALEILDRFRAGYAPDGSCDEGATYWWWAGATLFEALEVIAQISDGAIDGFGVEPVAAMCRFPMLMQISEDAQVNYSDASAALPPSASWHLLARFAERVGDRQVLAHARWMGRHHPFRMPDQLAPLFLRTVRELREPSWREGEAASGLPRSIHLPGTELTVAREEEGSSAGWFLAVKGGHNDVSHNHDDVGGVIASLDGEPVLIDVGVGVYRRETFEADTRYTIWTMRSSHHSCPLPHGVEQEHGEQFAARGTEVDETGGATTTRMDLAGAYPAGAELERCIRTATLDRAAGEIRVHDSWTFARPHRMAVVLMTSQEPRLGADGTLRIGPAVAALEGADVEVTSERIDVDDARLSPVWGDAVHRIVIGQREDAPSGELTVTLRRGDG